MPAIWTSLNSLKVCTQLSFDAPWRGLYGVLMGGYRVPRLGTTSRRLESSPPLALQSHKGPLLLLSIPGCETVTQSGSVGVRSRDVRLPDAIAGECHGDWKHDWSQFDFLGCRCYQGSAPLLPRTRPEITPFGQELTFLNLRSLRFASPLLTHHQA